MVSILDQAKAEHLADAAQRWDEAVLKLREALSHPDPQVGKLIRRLFTISDSTRWAVFGGMWGEYSPQTASYGGVIPCNALGVMNFVTSFASYHVAKHRDAGVAYWCHPDADEDCMGPDYLPCTKDHPGAHPYFHSSFDLLLKADPESAEYLTETRALEILEWYEAKRLADKAEMQADIASGGTLWDEEDLEMYDLSAQDLAYAALIAELETP